MAQVRTKICGLIYLGDAAICFAAGEAYVGFVLLGKSPRNVTVHQARANPLDVPAGIARVAIVVPPYDTLLQTLTTEVPPEMLQLRGGGTPKRVADIRSYSGLPVMKALGVADESDLARIDAYATVGSPRATSPKPIAASARDRSM